MQRLVRRGLPVPSVDEDARNHTGCGLCGIPEWSPNERGTKREERRCSECSKSGGCRNPACLRPESELDHNARGKGEKRRCKRCYAYRGTNSGKEWEAKVKNGCQNPACRLPESELDGRARGFGEERRCRWCHGYRERHKGEERVPGR